MNVIKIIRSYLWVRSLKKELSSFQRPANDDIVDASRLSLKHLKPSFWSRFKNLFKKIISIGSKKS
ncbi:hypothetical protein [Silvanigrella sp.]|jgi:hypothetical protein|uniref:hypothetical protein n=1 Tax=Silvanigrella sp. TaxID=2024976 RepID=UPI0037C65FEE